MGRRTTTINNNLNPIWNHQVTFDFDENAPTIDIEVFDEDTMATDDSLGRLSIDVAEIKRNKNVADAEASFENSSPGSIKYSAELVTSFTSSTSDIIDTQSIDKDAKKDNHMEQRETESTTSSFESTQTVTTMTQNIKESSEKKVDIVKSPLESDVTMESEEEPKALPKPEGETEDDLERKKEKKPENQGLGIEETRRLLLGEQMEEKYPAPGKKEEPDPEIQSDLEK